MVFAEGAFSAGDCELILSHQASAKQAAVADPGDQDGYRDSRVCWLRPSEETNWIFAKSLELISQVNQANYSMELSGFTEPLQLAEYGPGQHYDWHLDLGNERFSVRKLSFIVQLTEPADYEGGAVELLFNRAPQAAPKSRGAMIVFPSYVLHRVNPVTWGARKSLVGWIGGPPLR